MRTLVVNTGSSSLKLSILLDSVLEREHSIQRWHGGDDDDELRELLDGVGTIDSVGHRVVHGGPELTSSVLITDDVVSYLKTLTDLAPLHEPNAVAGIEATRRLLPEVPQVACFDTSFHSTMPPAAFTYPLPNAWNERWNLRRYGFHGLSHSYVSRHVPTLLGPGRADRRIISCHLGSGASICAVVEGRSVDTTMGFTPLEGLMMGTRSGSVDPGLLIWLQECAGLSLDEINAGIEKEGGLAGLSGTSGDMRDVRAQNDDASRLALAVYRHRLAACASSMVASAGGVDVLAFTGGVGEHDSIVRGDLVADLAYLGIQINHDENAEASSDSDVTGAGSCASVVVVTCREDLEVEREVTRLV